MIPSLRIVVADDEPDMRDYFLKFLTRMGHQVVGLAEDGIQLVDMVRTLQPDLVITDIKMPKMDGLEAANILARESPLPVILVSAFHDTELVQRAEADHVMGYLVKPIKLADLNPAIVLAMKRFQQMEKLRQEAEALRQQLPPV